MVTKEPTEQHHTSRVLFCSCCGPWQHQWRHCRRGERLAEVVLEQPRSSGVWRREQDDTTSRGLPTSSSATEKNAGHDFCRRWRPFRTRGKPHPHRLGPPVRNHSVCRWMGVVMTWGFFTCRPIFKNAFRMTGPWQVFLLTGTTCDSIGELGHWFQDWPAGGE